MFGKRPLKITARAWLSQQTAQTSLILTLIVGGVTLLCYLFVRFLCGAPYRMMLELAISDIVPPVWLFTLLQAVAFFTAGCAAGFVLGYRPVCCLAAKYKGGMLFVLAAAVELCWYPFLFIGGLVVVTLLQSILALALAILTTVSFFRVSSFAGWIFAFHSVWLLYILILSFRIFLRN